MFYTSDEWKSLSIRVRILVILTCISSGFLFADVVRRVFEDYWMCRWQPVLVITGALWLLFIFYIILDSWNEEENNE